MRRAMARSLAWLTAASPAVGLCQVLTDGTVGPQLAVNGPNFTIVESLGRRAGTNLLHSFSIFNVRAGQSATFTGAHLENVIARVTGGSPSAIDGLIRSTIPNSNLFLINPSGIVFGPTASINIPGSFHASTAHYLGLSDGTRIETRSAQGVTLTAAPPTAFGFLGTAAPVTLNGAQLRVADGRRISIAGGDVTLAAAPTGRVASLTALSGTIGIMAAQSLGEAVLAENGLRAEAFGAMGTLALRGGARVNVSEGTQRRGGGAISLAGGHVLLDHSSVESRTAVGNGRGIAVSGSDSIVVDASGVISVTTGAGNAGPLRLEGRDITLSGGSLVDTSCDPGCTTGAGGPLAVHATGTLTVLGDDDAVPTYLVSNSFGGGRTGAIDIRAGALTASGNALIQGIATRGGDGSSIAVTTGSIALTDGAQIDVSTRGAGRGGALSVNNSGAIRIEGTRLSDPQSGLKLPSGFFANTESSGNAGNIVVSTATLEVLRGGEISSSARRGSTGDGGNIAITARGLLRVAGTDAGGKSSGIVSNTFSSGAAGGIEIAADAIEIADEGRVQTQSEGAGRAGAIEVRGRTMLLSGRGQISSDARALGDGGSIDVSLAESLEIRGLDSGIFAKTYGPARGGSIVVSARDISMDDRGGIFAGTDGSGSGGDIGVAASRAIDMRNGASITSESRSTGLAGSIGVTAGDTLDMDAARITTAARSADGGDITLDVGRFATLRNSIVETQVGSGLGSGGNIVFRVPTLLMIDSVISANAFGGSGGNIRIGTTTFVPSGASRVTASSTLGIAGTITFESPAIDPTGELLVPPPAFLDAGSVLAGRCGPRLAGRASSLVVIPSVGPLAGPDEWRICTPVAMAR